MNDLDTFSNSGAALDRYQAAANLGVSDTPPPNIAEVLSHLMYNDPNLEIRHMAAWVAGQFQLEACIPALIQTLTGNYFDTDDNEETEPAVTSQQTGVEGSGTQEDEQVRFIAALALVRLDHANATAQLTQLVNHPNDKVRRSVESALRAKPYLLQNL